MKVENRERLIEIKGMLDGIAYCIDSATAEVLWDVVDTLDAILKDENKDKQDEERRT